MSKKKPARMSDGVYGPTSILIPIDLGERLTEISRERGISVPDLIRVLVDATIQKKPVLGLGDKIPFGKYSGHTVEHVVRVDPKYMNWAVENVSTVKFMDEVHELVERVMEKL